MKHLFIRPSPATTLSLLLIVLLALLLSNYLALRTYNRLSQHVSSIYKDRLLPASYLFQLHELLYRQKMTSAQSNGTVTQYREQVQAITDSMKRVMRDYEATYLTPLEKEQWRYFRQSLNQFEQAKQQLVADTASSTTSWELEREFYQANRYLSDLIALQLQEGVALKDASQSLLGSSVIQTYLQISLVIILCIFGYALYRLYAVRQTDSGRHIYN